MSQKLTVKDVMSKPVSIAKSALIPEALSKMLENGIDPIVVTHDHVVVGTASRRTIACNYIRFGKKHCLRMRFFRLSVLL